MDWKDLPPSLTERYRLGGALGSPDAARSGAGVGASSAVGAGSAGSVFRVTLVGDARPLALKVFAEISLFREELAVLARLRTAHGATLIEVSEVPLPTIALTFLEGKTLDAWSAKTGSRKENATLRIVRDLAQALAELHDAGVVHGDVKPENVIVEETADGPRASLIDLGLAHGVRESARGATPAYAAPELSRGIGVPASDVFALGKIARDLLGDLDWIAPLLLTLPEARPSARWIRDRAARELGVPPSAVLRSKERRARVERVYLAAHARDLDAHRPIDDSLEGPARALLEETMKWLSRRDDRPAAPLSPTALGRCVMTLTGIVEPRGLPGESVLVARLLELAEERELEGISLADLRGETRGPRPAFEGSLAGDPHDRLASLVARIVQRPSEADLAISERALGTPGTERSETLIVATAEALLHRGELGRAAAVARLGASFEARVLLADLLRREGDLAGAAKAASALVVDPVRGDEARAISGRILLDEGALDRAALALEGARGPAASEVRALIHLGRGEVEAACELAEDALVDEESPNRRARLSSVLGYAHHAAGRALQSFEAYDRAVRHAEDTGSLVELATYLTGLGAAACDLGRAVPALNASRRAAFLFERLSRPARAARSWLTQAAALALLGRVSEVREAVGLVEELGRGDDKARAYARLALADVLLGSALAANPEALVQVLEARDLLAHDSAEELRLAAFRLRAGDPSLSKETFLRFDRLAEESSVSVRLEWWGARALDALRGDAPGQPILTELRRLLPQDGPVASRLFAFRQARDLSARAGDAEGARAFAGEARALERRITADLPPDAERPDPSSQGGDDAQEAFHPEQVRQLESLVRSLVFDERVSVVAERILDALILWTGVERGLVLLPSPNGDLVPRAARNIARADLTKDQLQVSMGIARRALETKTIVVATDAFLTLGDLHASVHALRLLSVLAVPLVARGEVLGVVYLDDRNRRGAFGEKERAWVELVSVVAATVIADARERVRLRRSLRKEARATRLLETALAEREAELSTVRIELGEEKKRTRFSYDAIVGRSASMLQLLAVVDRVTQSDVPALIVGESGTGKELIARALHVNGARGKKSFVSENCAAVPESLLESTLFGHVKGAFTGASSARTGLFEIANGGTLFLDEVGEMSLALQSKLLRVLQEGEVRPVGGEKPRKVDVRLITATHRNLEEMVRTRAFREDLFYRLHVVELRVPPLRARKEDIPGLVAHFLEKYRAGARIKKRALDRLTSYAWPGNVRQLENEIRRALVMAEDEIDLPHLSDEVLGRASEEKKTLRGRIDALERELLVDALARSSGNQSQAARELGISRFGLQKMVKRLGI